MLNSPSHLCPNLVDRVSSDLGPEGLSYWTKLGGSQTSKSHADCTPARCFANDNRSGHNPIYHRDPSCGCNNVGPYMKDITEIIEADMIPVVAVVGLDSNPSIIVEAYKPGLVFTVISHALRDCLGNPQENKLPTCQVKKIRQIVSSLTSSHSMDNQRPWFWIDTLCVPLERIRDPSTRGTVTRSMKSISQSATQTLVLDSDISRLTSNSEATELFTRIAYSSWSSRIWTLQEAVLAQSLFFHFSDQNVSLETLMAKFGYIPPHWESARGIRFPYKNLRWYLDRTFDDDRARGEKHFSLLLKALNGREISDPADRPLVIANLMGIDRDDVTGSAELSEFLHHLDN